MAHLDAQRRDEDEDGGGGVTATTTMFRARIVSIFVLFVCVGVARGRTGYATKERISSVWGNDRVVTWITGGRRAFSHTAFVLIVWLNFVFVCLCRLGCNTAR